MECKHEHKIAWETDCRRVGCLDCGAILLCDKAEPAPVEPIPAEVKPVKVYSIKPKNQVLSEKGKLVMELRGLNWTYEDIATHIGKSVGVVKMFETIAKKALKREG